MAARAVARAAPRERVVAETAADPKEVPGAVMVATDGLEGKEATAEGAATKE